VAFVRAASRRVTRGKCSTIAPFLALLSIPVGQCHGDWTFIGPTPYRSTADSPFPISINPNFFVETFEDGLLNTRGIVQKNPFPLPGTGGLAFVRLPGQNTDSVDGDDGLVDGLGLGGHSLASGTHVIIPTNPLRHEFRIEFEFDETELGFLPDSFGFVWTDGPALSSLGLQIVTESGIEFVPDPIAGLGDLGQNGSTLDDVFLGVVGTDRIRAVTVIGGFRGDLTSPPEIEIDHVQYGLTVPEPSTIALAVSFLAFFLKFYF
jgi:hypothetical protein